MEKRKGEKVRRKRKNKKRKIGKGKMGKSDFIRKYRNLVFKNLRVHTDNQEFKEI